VHHTAQEGTRYWLHQHIDKDSKAYPEFFKGFPPWRSVKRLVAALFLAPIPDSHVHHS
jgi:hypothetical protein